MKQFIQSGLSFVLFWLAIPGFAQWEWQNPLPQGNWLKDVTFVSETQGWAVGERGTIITTTDGGQNWSRQECGTDSDLEAVYFHDILNGFVAGGASG